MVWSLMVLLVRCPNTIIAITGDGLFVFDDCGKAAVAVVLVGFVAALFNQCAVRVVLVVCGLFVTADFNQFLIGVVVVLLLSIVFVLLGAVAVVVVLPAHCLGVVLSRANPFTLLDTGDYLLTHHNRRLLLALHCFVRRGCWFGSFHNSFRDWNSLFALTTLFQFHYCCRTKIRKLKHSR